MGDDEAGLGVKVKEDEADDDGDDGDEQAAVGL